MNEFYKNLPERIRKVGMNYSDFAKVVGCSQSTISNATLGKQVAPMTDQMIRITIEKLERAENADRELANLIAERKKAAEFIAKTFLKDNEFAGYIQTFIEGEIEKR